MTASISGFRPPAASVYSSTSSTTFNSTTGALAKARLAQPTGLLALQTPSSTTTRPTSIPKVVPQQPPQKIPPKVPNTGLTGPLLRGFAIGIGLSIGYSLPDWLRSGGGGSHDFLEGEASQCEPKTVAANYLNNLKQDGVDQAVKAIPPKVFEWKTPNGYQLSVKQGWSKDGLVYNATLQGPDGKKNQIGPVKAQITSKGVKIPLGSIPFLVAGENFGKLDMLLQVGKTGLGGVEMAFTSNEGIVSTLKLKPQACGLDLTQSQLLRVNAGDPAEARRWAELHLTQSAQKNGGSLKEGLHDLLTVIKPSANGVYRNHGSDALGVITKPLNALIKAGFDMEPLNQFQNQAAGTDRNSTAYRLAKSGAARWLTQALTQAIAQGKIAPLDLSNAYKINHGVAAIVSTQGPLQKPAYEGKVPTTNIGPQTARAIKASWRDLQQVAAGSGYALTQLGDGRLFAVGVKPDKESQSALLKRLASVLRVKPEQLAWRNESQNIKGLEVKGIAIEPRVYVR